MTVDAEGDPHVQQRDVGGLLAALKLPFGEGFQTPGQRLCAGARLPALVEHLVVETLGAIRIELHPPIRDDTALELVDNAGFDRGFSHAVASNASGVPKDCARASPSRGCLSSFAE